MFSYGKLVFMHSRNKTSSSLIDAAFVAVLTWDLIDNVSSRFKFSFELRNKSFYVCAYARIYHQNPVCSINSVLLIEQATEEAQLWSFDISVLGELSQP